MTGKDITSGFMSNLISYLRTVIIMRWHSTVINSKYKFSPDMCTALISHKEGIAFFLCDAFSLIKQTHIMSQGRLFLWWI